MKKKIKFSLIAYLMLVGTCLILPAFIYSFVTGEGNTVDKVFFGSSAVGFASILLGTVIGLVKGRNEEKNGE